MRPLLNDKNHYNFVLDNLFIALATFFWLSYVPIAINSVAQILKNRKVFVEKDLRRIHNDPAIIFQITTRSATKTPVVKRGILSILNSAHKVNFYNYQISVITDDANDVKTLEKEKCEIVTVDKDFRTNAIKKGRALQYAVEHRRRSGSADPAFPRSRSMRRGCHSSAGVSGTLATTSAVAGLTTSR